MRKEKLKGKIIIPPSKLNAIRTEVLESGNLIMYHDKAMTSLIRRALED